MGNETVRLGLNLVQEECKYDEKEYGANEEVGKGSIYDPLVSHFPVSIQDFYVQLKGNQVPIEPKPEEPPKEDETPPKEDEVPPPVDDIIVEDPPVEDGGCKCDPCNCDPCNCDGCNCEPPTECPHKAEFQVLEVDCSKPIYLKFNCPPLPSDTQDPYLVYVNEVSRPTWKKETQQIRNDMETLRDELPYGTLREGFKALKDRLSLLVASFNASSIKEEMNK